MAGRANDAQDKTRELQSKLCVAAKRFRLSYTDVAELSALDAGSRA